MRITRVDAREYFTVFPSSDGIIEFMSNCTGHIWKVEKYDFGFDLFHSHSVLDDYHYQTSFRRFEEVVEYIKDHDVFQMDGRRRRRVVSRALVLR